MKSAIWRGRLVMMCLSCMALLGAGGCTGLSDRQLSSVLQAALSTGLSSLVSLFITGAATT
jgi:hypothetical protein